MPQIQEVTIRGISRITLMHLLVSIVYVLILSIPLIFFFYAKTLDLFPTCSINNAECVGEKLAQQRLHASSTWAALISLASATGALGTILSFFLRLTKSELINDNPQSTSVVTYFIGLREILILCWFGTVFGLLMLSLFVGSFVQGELFPEIDASFWIEIDLRIKSWAKLAIWCFIAGFSERLIPSLLDSLVKRIEEVPGSKSTDKKGLQKESTDSGSGSEENK